MNTPLSSRTLRSRQVVETTVFQSGNSQAIRIPKEFQFHTKRVEIAREGRSIVLRPMAMTAAEALADLPPLSEAEARAFDQAMADVDDLPSLDEPENLQPQPKVRAKRKAR
ncbi:MAG: hypothetical protein A2Z90_04095 [Burkholderiales bacterium GWA2_64_37]|jgi:antitoxin VapB|nr:MAG: hypothetical protein A2Z90_04095 [Burkholderiales bacterium GWA2_64_37]HCE93287.1 AbrB/MazE/SpoVT family DNA-binding domain-containing protein [Acidovorax sp.]